MSPKGVFLTADPAVRRSAPPRAGAMIESLRGLGYSTATAVADIIDNSISAAATVVSVKFDWNDGDPFVTISDDGNGMNERGLEAAMQLGARSPLEERSARDLGRFGLGLKTASFSQGRRLTVASCATGEPAACFRWDLDLLSHPHDEGWHLYVGWDPASEGRLSALDGMEHGTVVLWENLDRLAAPGSTVQDFLDLQDEIERHLAMTFHRLLECDDDLAILLNDRPISPWDPFMAGHPGKAWASAEYALAGSSDVKVQCHVLPHKDMLKVREADAAAGPGGWISQQGFYVYRNKRLLVAGGWLGLETHGRLLTRDEPHRLARIRLDIPNSSDAEWKIDIRKSSARAPARFRRQLLRLALEAREKARKVFAHRGQWSQAPTAKPVTEAWLAERSGGATRYRISRDHDAVSSLLERAGPLRKEVEALLRVVEATVPVQRIWLDTVEDHETPRTGLPDAPDPEIVLLMQMTFRNMVEIRGLAEDEARARLTLTAPFDRYHQYVSTLSLSSQEPV